MTTPYSPIGSSMRHQRGLPCTPKKNEKTYKHAGKRCKDQICPKVGDLQQSAPRPRDVKDGSKVCIEDVEQLHNRISAQAQCRCARL